MKNLVILGAGTAGTMMANKLLHKLNGEEWTIKLIDQDNVHIYQPGLLFLPFGYYDEADLIRSRKRYIPQGIEYIQSKILELKPDKNKVVLKKQCEIDYDLLIVATGTVIDPSKTEGLNGEGWNQNIFDFYTLEGAKGLAKKLANFNKGRLILNIVDMPIKCPVAPLEFLFLADEYFTKKGIRDDIELVFATPLDGAFTKPKSAAMLGGLLEQKKIIIESNYNIEKVNPQNNQIHSYDDRILDYDLLVSIPLHFGVEAIAQSSISDDMGFVKTDQYTLQSDDYDNIFALGDATNLPTSKAGSVAHFQAEVLVQNISDYLQGRSLSEKFDGHSNCFIETGHGKAMLIDFNYKTEPLPGKFPLPAIGPFSLLAESELNHWGKLAFKWIYWNMLITGKELPIDHNMLMAGKWRE